MKRFIYAAVILSALALYGCAGDGVGNIETDDGIIDSNNDNYIPSNGITDDAPDSANIMP